MITRLLIIIVSFFISFNTYSNTPIREVTFEKLTSKDGLSQHDVRITSYNVCYTKLLRRIRRDVRDRHGRSDHELHFGYCEGDSSSAETA